MDAGRSRKGSRGPAADQRNCRILIGLVILLCTRQLGYSPAGATFIPEPGAFQSADPFYHSSLGMGLFPPTPPQQGPVFLLEPPPRLAFSNTSGAEISCSAHGAPPPDLSWILADGSRAEPVPGLRQPLSNGTLYFPPFRAEDYRDDVHSAVYRCRAANLGGVILSREVRVRAVIRQDYEVQVYRSHVLLGNAAVLRCIIPPFVRDYVTVTAWLRDDTLILPGASDTGTSGPEAVPTSSGGNRFIVTVGTGELIIRGTRPEDGAPRYSCITRHMLTGERKTSVPATLTVTEPSGSMPPRLTQRLLTTVTVDAGSDIHLNCAAQGNPPPTFIWEKADDNAGVLGLNSAGGSSGRPRVIGPSDSPLLLLRRVSSKDAGRWECRAANAFGEQNLGVILATPSPLSVHVQPQLLVVKFGESATFNCSVSGSPIDTVRWLANGMPLTGSGQGVGGMLAEGVSPRIRLLSAQVLHISSVGRGDRGMYQCVAKNERESAQGSAELRLGEMAPELQGTFIEQTLRPGPGVSLRCSAAGSPPPRFLWALDGQPLTPHNAGHRFSIGQYLDSSGDVVSHVNISSVRTEDGGLYSCTAGNNLGEAKHTARLNVYGAPRIRNIPPVTAVAGSNLLLLCPYSGFPVGAVRWERRSRRRRRRRRRRQLSHPSTQGATHLRHRTFSENGTLLLTKVEAGADGGAYSCSVSGRGLRGEEIIARGEVIVRVKSPPVIEPFNFPEHTREGSRLQISCSVSSGDLPLRFVWLKDNKLLPLPSSSTMPSNSYSLGFPHPTSNSPSSLNQQPYYTTTQGDFFSLLVVPHVSAAHSGRYTCITSNDVASANHSATLLVNVAPQWVMEPRDVSTLAGGWVSVHCQAKGFPDPTVVWMRGSGRSQTDYQKVTARQSDSVPIGTNPNHWSRIYLPPNGTLTISNAAEHDEGYYLCKASNGIGAGLTKVIYIAVNEPVKFEMSSKNITARKGDAVTLVCDVRGDHPIHILWLMNGRRLNLNSFRFSLSEAKSDNGVVSRMLIGGSERQDSGNYVCQADNAFGHAEQTLNLAIQEPPDAPTDVEVLEVSSRSVRLAWKIPFSGHSPLIAFVVQYKPISHSSPFSPSATSSAQENDWTSANFSANAQGGVLSGVLRPATAFNLRVLALNAIGYSAPSEVLSIKTQEEAPMGPPQEVQLEALGPEELQVSWKPPLRELWNGQILGYTVTWRLQNDDQLKPGRNNNKENEEDGSKPATDVSSGGGDGKASGEEDEINTKSRTIRWEGGANGEGDPNSLRLRIGGLRRFSRYAVTVRAFNRVGSGPRSAPVTAHTREGVPEASPDTVSCVALSSQSLMVRWAPPPPHTHGGLLRGYKVIYTPIGPADSSEGNENDEDDRESFVPSTKEGRNNAGLGSSLNGLGSGTETKRITGTETHLHGLKKFTNYSLRLLAYTAVGDGVPSNPLTCSTEEDVPGPPASIKAVALSSDSVLVSWLPPVLPNGRLLQYTVYSREAGRRPSKHSNYQVRAGSGQSSSSSSSSSLAKSGGAGWGWGRELTYEVRGLTEHTSYEFWATASTVVGEGLPTPLVSQTPTSRAPARIASFSRVVRRPVGSPVWLPCLAVGNPSPTTKWSWGGNEVPSASGTDVAEGQGFRAVPRRSGVGGGSGGELFAPKLEKRWEGNYSCRASNLFGQDDIMYAVVALTPPEQPSDLMLQYATDSSLHLKWKAPHNGGSPIKGYVLSYKREHGSWTEVALEASALSSSLISSPGHHHVHHHLQQQPGIIQYHLQSLRCGSPYQVYVTARNRVGSGPPSDILNAVTQGGVSKVPSQNDLLSINSTSVSMHLYTWPNGGCPFLYFAVQHRPLLSPSERENNNIKRINSEDEDGWVVMSNNVPPDTERLVLRGLSPATWYELRITAYNDAGSTVGLFRFATTTRSGATIAPPVFLAEAGGKGGESPPYGISEGGNTSFYNDVYWMIPITVAVVLGLATSFLIGCLIVRKKKLCLNFGTASPDTTDGNSKQGGSISKEGGSGDSSSCCKIVGAGSNVGLSGPPTEAGIARHRGSRDGDLAVHQHQGQRQIYTSSPVAGGLRSGGMSKAEETEDMVPRCDKLKDDQGDMRSELYEISPYATFSVPVSNSSATPGCGSSAGVNSGTNRGGTMDYTMQFRTFGHSECGMGQMPKGKKRYNNANYGNKQRFTETREPFGIKGEGVCGSNRDQPLFKQHTRKESLSEDDRDDGVGMEHRQNLPPHHLNIKQLSQGGGYRVPVKRGGSDSYYRPDSSTESNEASPQECGRRRGWRRGLDRSKEEMRMRSRSLGEAEEDDDGEDDEEEEGLQDASVMLHPTLPAGSLGEGSVGGWALVNNPHLFNRGSYEKTNGHHWQKQGMMGLSREPSDAECDRHAVLEDNNGVDGDESLGTLSNGNSVDDIDDGNIGKLTTSVVNEGELEAQLALLLARFQEQKDQERMQYTIHV